MLKVGKNGLMEANVPNKYVQGLTNEMLHQFLDRRDIKVTYPITLGL